MASRVYFAFHYQDVVDFRANVVRNHWLTKPDREAAGFFDASLWESAEKQGSIRLKRLINGGLERTTVSCVLIGTETYRRPWVRYEMLKSFKRGNKLLATHINSIPGKDRGTKPSGPNPLEFVGVRYSVDGQSATLLEHRNGVWNQYAEIDGSDSYSVNVSQQFRGQAFSLNQFYSVYDWTTHNGYANFANWIG